MTEEPVPVRRLDRPRRKGAMRKQGGMGIGHHRADRNAVGQAAPSPRAVGNGPVEATTRGRAAQRHVENRKQLLVPAPADDIEKLRARGVAGLDHRLAAEARQKERVDCSDADLARLGAGLTLREAVEQPARLGGGEHRIERQPALSSDRRRRARRRAARRSSPRSAGPATTGPASAPRRSDDPRSTQDSRCVLRPTETTRLAVAGSSASATARRTLAQISFASCSTHPGSGVASDTGAWPRPTTSPRSSTTSAFGRARALVDREDQRVRHLHCAFNSSAAATMPSRLEPEMIEQELGASGRGEARHAEDAHRNRGVAHDDLGDRGAKAALDHRLLDRDDRAGLARRGDDRRLVERLDGRDVDHPRLDALLGESVRGCERPATPSPRSRRS